MKKSVEAYLDKHKDWDSELEFLREILCNLDLKEQVKWGAPIYTVNDKNVVGLCAYKSYVG